MKSTKVQVAPKASPKKMEKSNGVAGKKMAVAPSPRKKGMPNAAPKASDSQAKKPMDGVNGSAKKSTPTKNGGHASASNMKKSTASSPRSAAGSNTSSADDEIKVAEVIDLTGIDDASPKQPSPPPSSLPQLKQLSLPKPLHILKLKVEPAAYTPV